MREQLTYLLADAASFVVWIGIALVGAMFVGMLLVSGGFVLQTFANAL
jgi:hypothetical protein